MRPAKVLRDVLGRAVAPGGIALAMVLRPQEDRRDSLVARAHEAGIEAITLSPMLGDFNDDLVTRGLDALRAHIRVQLAPEDVSRFMTQDHFIRQSG